jgi:hypothetical protein
MRYLSLLAAILASTPAYAAEFTHQLELPPGFAERWQAPRPFKDVIPGNTAIVDVVQGQTNLELIIITKPEGGTTNVVLLDEYGEKVANLLITNPTIRYLSARSAETGTWEVYRNDDTCNPVCVRIRTKPNDGTPTRRIVSTSQTNEPQPN